MERKSCAPKAADLFSVPFSLPFFSLSPSLFLSLSLSRLFIFFTFLCCFLFPSLSSFSFSSFFSFSLDSSRCVVLFFEFLLPCLLFCLSNLHLACHNSHSTLRKCSACPEKICMCQLARPCQWDVRHVRASIATMLRLSRNLRLSLQKCEIYTSGWKVSPHSLVTNPNKVLRLPRSLYLGEVLRCACHAKLTSPEPTQRSRNRVFCLLAPALPWSGNAGKHSVLFHQQPLFTIQFE